MSWARTEGALVKKLLAIPAGIVFALWSSTAVAPVALAQYQGTTSSTTGGTTSSSQSAGTLREGDSFINEACGFQPNSPVTLTLNGNNAGTDGAEGDGCARQTVRIVDSGTAAGRATFAAVGGSRLFAQSSGA